MSGPDEGKMYFAIGNRTYCCERSRYKIEVKRFVLCLRDRLFILGTKSQLYRIHLKIQRTASSLPSFRSCICLSFKKFVKEGTVYLVVQEGNKRPISKVSGATNEILFLTMT